MDQNELIHWPTPNRMSNETKVDQNIDTFLLDQNWMILEQKQDTGVSDRVWFKDFSRFRQNGKKEGLTWLNTGLTGKHGIGSKDELERYFQRYVRYNCSLFFSREQMI